METILVAGGAGFLGSHLCEYLLNKDYSVICVDNLITGKFENIQHLVPDNDFLFYNRNIVNYNSTLFDYGIKYIFNLASIASPIEYMKHPIETLEVGSIGTQNLLELAKFSKARYLFTSTSEIYGEPVQHPQNEQSWGRVSTTGLRACYDNSKRFSESLVMEYHRVHKVDIRIARIFNTYGPKMSQYDGRVISTFIRQLIKNEDITIFGDGNQTRSFCYVNDLIEGLYRLMLSDYIYPVNLGNPDEYTVNDMLKILFQVTGETGNIIYKQLPQDDPTKRKPNIDLAENLLNWTPVTSLNYGLLQTYKWMKKEIDLI